MEQLNRRRILGQGFAAVAGTAGLSMLPTSARATPCATGYGVTIAYIGALTDYSVEFNDAIQTAYNNGGGYVLVGRGNYRFLYPIFLLPGVSLIGEGTRAERGYGTVLTKRGNVQQTGQVFSGSALVQIVKRNSLLPSRILIDGIAIQDNGANQGGGLLIEDASDIKLNNVVVYKHKSYGLQVRASQRVSMSGLTCVANGQDGSSPGLKIDGTATANAAHVSDCRIIDSVFNKNLGQQIQITGSGSPGSVSGVSVLGCQIETGLSNTDTTLTLPLLESDCLENATIMACNFATASQNIRCVSLGGSASKPVNNVSLISCQFGSSNASPHRIALKDGVGAVNFTDLRYGGTSPLLIKTELSGPTGGSPNVLVSAMPALTSSQFNFSSGGVLRTPTLIAPV